jgi:23S rRNA pseudouridine2605 synthase
MRAFILNKPPGCVTARRDFAGRPTVYAHVPTHFPALPHVGRLDFASEGLLLFSDDGRLARALLDSAWRRQMGWAPILKIYHVKVRDRLDPEDPRLARLAEPIRLRRRAAGTSAGPSPTRPARARFLLHRSRATWIEVAIEEGRNQQLRRLCARSGLDVLKLRRVSIGPLELGELPMRWCRPLSPTDWAALYAAALPGEASAAYEEIDDSELARAGRPRTPARAS